jgi:hypothetical protein
METLSGLSLWQRFSSRSRATTSSNENRSLKEPNEKFRLIQLTPQPDPSSSTIGKSEASKIDEEEHKVDIVAVHGLGGDPYKTWTHENGTLWLRDIAGQQLPGARIYTFGYDSGFAFSQGTGNIRNFARSLLEALRLERTSQEVLSPFGCSVKRADCGRVGLILTMLGPENSLCLPQYGGHCC